MIIRELAVTAAGSENGRAVQIRTVGGLAQDQMPGLRETLTLLCRSIQFDRSPPLKFEVPLACCHGWSTRGYTAPANLEAGAPRSASLPFLLLRMTPTMNALSFLVGVITPATLVGWLLGETPSCFPKFRLR